MRYVARSPREGVNVSPEHPLAEALTLTLGLGALLVALAALAVFFVDIVVALVPPRTEAELFADFDFASVLPARLEEAPPLQALAERLSRHWPDSPYQFKVAVLDETRLNALALPGGTILVTRGLVDAAESENELAFVIGHEIGHFKNRDHLRQLGRGFAFGLLLLVVSGSDGGFVGSNVLATARAFDRRQESAADRVAAELVQAEYGHVAGAWRFLERRASENAGLDRFAAYFRTHPASAARVNALEELAAARGWATAGRLTPVAH
jgi:Zn-dependent protease with chaperone function